MQKSESVYSDGRTTKRKLTELEVAFIKKCKEQGISVKELSEFFEIGKDPIYRALKS